MPRPPEPADLQIERIVEQWRRERPDLDSAPMRLLGGLAQAAALATPYIERVLVGHGLTRGTFDVLSALRRAGRPFSLAPKQLSEFLLLSGAGMTNRLDRLEAAHLIARLPDPDDRRSLQIHLTQKGLKLTDEIVPHFIDRHAGLVRMLGAEKTERLVALLGELTEALAHDPPDRERADTAPARALTSSQPTSRRRRGPLA